MLIKEKNLNRDPVALNAGGAMPVELSKTRRHLKVQTLSANILSGKRFHAVQAI